MSDLLAFTQIRKASKISMKALAQLSDTTPGDLSLFEIGGRLDQEKRERIVQALNTLAGTQYCVSDFYDTTMLSPPWSLPKDI